MQVKFAFESFCRLRPGMPLKMLHGRMKQMTRLAVFYDFCESQSAALFATDIAARGLDFPAVDWVVQVGRRGDDGMGWWGRREQGGKRRA